MGRFHGTPALQLDFGGSPRRITATAGPGRPVLRLAILPPATAGIQDKYRTLERRRRQAQIAARRLLNRVEREPQ